MDAQPGLVQSKPLLKRTALVGTGSQFSCDINIGRFTGPEAT